MASNTSPPVAPIEINLPGLTKGIALDIHTADSVQVGQKQFQSTYTRAGQLVHDLKYGRKVDGKAKDFLSPKEAESLIELELKPLISAVLPALELPRHLMVLPVPSFYSSQWEKERKHQYKIAKAVAEILQVKSYEYLKKTVVTNSKSMPQNSKFGPGAFELSPPLRYPSDVLLVDDVYGTGSTATACIDVLQSDPNVKNIFLLTISSIRTTGLKA